jgi:cell division protein FtsB
LTNHAKQNFTEKIERDREAEKIARRVVKAFRTAEAPGFGAKIAAVAYRSRRRLATVLAIIVAALLGYHVIFGSNGLTVYQQKKNEDQALQKEIHQLEQENSRLKEHVEHLKTDPDAIEHEARMILHYTRPGEVIYKLNDEPSSDAKPGASTK